MRTPPWTGPIRSVASTSMREPAVPPELGPRAEWLVSALVTWASDSRSATRACPGTDERGAGLFGHFVEQCSPGTCQELGKAERVVVYQLTRA